MNEDRRKRLGHSENLKDYSAPLGLIVEEELWVLGRWPRLSYCAPLGLNTLRSYVEKLRFSGGVVKVGVEGQRQLHVTGPRLRRFRQAKAQPTTRTDRHPLANYQIENNRLHLNTIWLGLSLATL